MEGIERRSLLLKALDVKRQGRKSLLADDKEGKKEKEDQKEIVP